MSISTSTSFFATFFLFKVGTGVMKTSVVDKQWLSTDLKTLHTLERGLGLLNRRERDISKSLVFASFPSKYLAKVTLYRRDNSRINWDLDIDNGAVGTKGRA